MVVITGVYVFQFYRPGQIGVNPVITTVEDYCLSVVERWGRRERRREENTCIRSLCISTYSSELFFEQLLLAMSLFSHGPSCE